MAQSQGNSRETYRPPVNAFMIRVMAGCYGFLTLIQFGEVPAR
jgi:hypothetical protein